MFELVYKNLQINVKENYSETYEGNNICILKGPNDSGKTTVLSLIKLAFSNFQLDEIDNETMKNKMRLILDNPDFKMNLSVSSYDNTFRIKIEYSNNSKRADYYINDKPVGYTYFSEETELLYEVPGEAIKKLDGILYDIKNKLSEYGTILTEYENHINEMYDKLTEYENSEKRRKEIISKIESLNKMLDSMNPTYEEDLKNYQDLYNKFIYNKYQKLDLEISNIELRIDNLNKKVKKNQYKNKKINKYQNELINKGASVYDIITYNKSLFDSFIEKNEEYQKIFGEELKLLINNNGEDINEELISKLNTYFILIKEQILKKLKNSSDSESVLQYRLIKQLIELINQYIDKNPVIPIFDDNASTLLDKLYSERKKLEDANNEYTKLNDLNSACDHIINELGNLTLILNNYNTEKTKNETETQSDSEGNEEDYESQIEELKNQEKSLIKEQMQIEDEYNKLTQSYNRYDLDTLERNLKTAENHYKMDKEKIDSLNKDIKDQKNLIENLKMFEKPSYAMTKSEMELEFDKLAQIKKKLKNYKCFIDLLLKNNYNNVAKDNSSNKFYDVLGKYIANIIKFIYHLHKKYYLLGIDFINREYIIDPKESDIQKISFDSIGTGTSALNGLMTRMQQDTNGKKLVILVDEIGDMDNSNLENLIKNAEKEIESNRLLLMLMTRPDNNDMNTKSKAICESINFTQGDETYGTGRSQ